MTTYMKNFHIKTKVLFGNSGIAELGDIAKQNAAGKALLVADPSLDTLGLLEPARKSLEGRGVQCVEFHDVEPEPYLDGADGAAALGRESDVDLVIGIGGGSALDTAKAAAVLITNSGKAEDYIGLDKVPNAGIPTVMVPTTAGTGAEVTFTAVFTNRETKAKGGINSPYLFPDVALLDPELTLTLPPDVTAATGMDALTHAVESVTSRSATVMTEALAHASIRLIAENLRQAVFHGDDLDAREKMLMGSLLGGLALANAGVGAAHALAYPLGGNYRVPHGLANAILIPHVMEFNLPAAQKQFMMVAQCMGEPVGGLSTTDAANAAVEAVRSLCRDIGIPSSLTELGISNSDIPMLVEGALTVARPIENNPRYVGPDEAHLIYDRAFA